MARVLLLSGSQHLGRVFTRAQLLVGYHYENVRRDAGGASADVVPEEQDS